MEMNGGRPAAALSSDLSPTIGEAACVVPESASTIPAIDLKVASLPLDGREALV